MIDNLAVVDNLGEFRHSDEILSSGYQFEKNIVLQICQTPFSIEIGKIKELIVFKFGSRSINKQQNYKSFKMGSHFIK